MITQGEKNDVMKDNSMKALLNPGDAYLDGG